MTTDPFQLAMLSTILDTTLTIDVRLECGCRLRCGLIERGPRLSDGESGGARLEAHALKMLQEHSRLGCEAFNAAHCGP